jgi:hypothetical protein
MHGDPFFLLWVIGSRSGGHKKGELNPSSVINCSEKSVKELGKSYGEIDGDVKYISLRVINTIFE